MLVDGVTINVGGDWSVGFCAAAISVDNSITGMHSKTIEAAQFLPKDQLDPDGTFMSWRASLIPSP